MQHQFFMHMKNVPTTTHQMKQVRVTAQGKPAFYEPDELKQARAKLTAHLAAHQPKAPCKGAVRLHVKWCFPVVRGCKDGDYKITRPDTDNLQKLLRDCMTAVGFWQDDAQVACEIVEKFHADITGIWVRVEDGI